MSKILRRPMFRMGGSANSKGTGITSGLEDRPGYAEAGSVSPSIDINELGRQFEELQKIKEQYGIKPPEAPRVGMGLSDWLDIAGTGLEIAFTPGRSTGEIIAEKGSPLLQRIGERLKSKEEKGREVENTAAAMKAGDIEAVYEQLGKEALKRAEGEGKGFALEKKIELIGNLTNDINQLRKQLNDPSVDKEEIQRQMDLKEAQLSTLTEKDVMLDAFLNSPEGEYLFSDIGDFVQETINPATGVEWEETDPGYYTELMRVAKETLRSSSYKKGGRVGMQVGGMTPAPTPASVPGSMPQQTQTADVQSLSYDDLRARLPKEITNDIVQLISASEQALSEFANIRTQADVDNFNKKYNVNLVLPQEA